MENRVDFHSHILPGADHGSDSVETSLKQVELLKSQGIRKVVATPHFYPQERSVEKFLKLRNSCALQLKNALKDDSLQIFLGAEVLICNGMDHMEKLSELCVYGANCLLLEMPFIRFSDALFNTVEAITEKHPEIQVVLAHIDRYHPDDILELLELPVLAQVNAVSLTSKSTRRFVVPLIESGKVVAFGSDLHKDDKKTCKEYKKGLSSLGEEYEKAVYERTEKLLFNAKSLNFNEIT